MSLIIDAREAFNVEKAGKGIYTLSMINALKKELNQEEVVLLVNRKLKISLPQSWQLILIPGDGIKWQFKAAAIIRSYPKAILFSPTSFLLPFLVKNKSIVTVHDLIAFLYSKDHNLKAVLIEHFCLPRLINHSHLIAVSESTKRDLVQLFPKLDPQKVSVVYEGLSTEFVAPSASKKSHIKKNQKQVLTVSTLIPRKNLNLLIDAFSQLQEANKDYREYKLHIVGAKGWQNSTLAKSVEKCNYKDNLVFHGYISNCKLQKLYQQSSVFVYPSLYEGFGLPLLEAMANQCAIISSNTSSLPEVAGDAALYFDPRQRSDLINQLQYLLKNTETQHILAEKGKDQLRKFSWGKAAKAFSQIYLQLNK